MCGRRGRRTRRRRRMSVFDLITNHLHIHQARFLLVVALV
jgi:hypothetical protein